MWQHTTLNRQSSNIRNVQSGTSSRPSKTSQQHLLPLNNNHKTGHKKSNAITPREHTHRLIDTDVSGGQCNLFVVIPPTLSWVLDWYSGLNQSQNHTKSSQTTDHIWQLTWSEMKTSLKGWRHGKSGSWLSYEPQCLIFVGPHWV